MDNQLPALQKHMNAAMVQLIELLKITNKVFMRSSSQILESCQEKIIALKSIIPIITYERRMQEITELSANQTFWSDIKNATSIMKERQLISDIINKMNYFNDQYFYYKEYCDVFPQEFNNMTEQLNLLERDIVDFEFKQIMHDPIDNNPAILTINAGAGGLEAKNFVSMLLRMYSRYANNSKFKVELLDMKPSEEHSTICIDSVSIRIEGPYAYGFLKGEAGVHRLIRNSPFNSGDARHTSFAAVGIFPDIEDTIDIKIEDKDIDIIAIARGGSGGQNQNKVASAIRLRHFPTGINILVRSERDFHANKKTAFKMLRSKLYDLELKKKQEEKDKQIGTLSDVAFGHQSRTYIESPKALVKDHRTDFEKNSFDKVLDGDIHDFIVSYLHHKK